MRGYKVKLVGTGAYLPGNPVKFDDINKVLGSIEGAPANVTKWFTQIQPIMKELLGVEQYHYAIDPETREFTETNISMSVKAAKKAMQDAGLKPEDIDFLAYGSSCLEQMPTASVRIQEELGIKACAEMSIHSNCTSTYKAIMLAHDLIANGRYKTAMVISSNMASSLLRSEYFNLELLQRDQIFIRWFLCDGAGCMIFARDESETPKGSYLEASYVESIGCGWDPIMFDRREAYSMNPLEVYKKGLHHMVQKGTTILEGEEKGHMLSNAFMEGLDRMAKMFDIDLKKTTYFQINLPTQHVFDLIKEKCTKLGMPEDVYYTKLRDYGYVGPPMVLITMDRLFKEESIKPGDQIISFVTEVSKVMQGGFMIKCY